ncbi:GNAT family N-acetyltransferase [Kribbella sindirgiensis]|uniref:GNAT family N-acetyltransferase n=1 Tax=Kribbella sindirgiensis TaxID=1124744 RepID=A0A4R0IBJ5_9ACTN|nr:GNAT family N-acetyltransferase [Kribbella sindirgiensis]TCC29244.1 GNAT family N-acetyltransferase [Kribbella sindirgiensis]
MSLPAGYTTRPTTLSDAALIAERSGRYTSALLGSPKHSPEDVANYLRDPGTDLATDAWIVFDPNGDFAGSATAVPITGGTHVNVDVLSGEPAVLDWLLAQAEGRAREVSPAVGEDGVVLRVGVIRQDERLAAVAAARGFAIGTSTHRMRITFDGPMPPPAVPEGIVVRRGAPDEASRRAAHGVLMEAFADQPETLPRPFEEWAASRESRSTFDWSQVTVVEADGRAVGMTECNHNFVSTDNCGYVGRLGVVPSARGRGLAKFLLRNAFATDAAAGRTGTILHVDAGNPTPAVALYTGAGMQPDLTSDIWTKTVRR